MSNPWIAHIKDYAKKNNLSYGCALSDPMCRSSYKSKKDLDTPVMKKIKVIKPVSKITEVIKPVMKKITEVIKPMSKITEVIKPVMKKIKNVTPLTKKQGLTISEKERAQDIKDDYMAKVDSSIILTGYKRRGTDNRSKMINTLASEYYKLTGEQLPSRQMIRKDDKKTEKQQKKIEEELARKKALEPVKSVGPITGFRQKKIGFLL